jgi:hypothetical protein
MIISLWHAASLWAHTGNPHAEATSGSLLPLVWLKAHASGVLEVSCGEKPCWGICHGCSGRGTWPADGRARRVSLDTHACSICCAKKRSTTPKDGSMWAPQPAKTARAEAVAPDTPGGVTRTHPARHVQAALGRAAPCCGRAAGGAAPKGLLFFLSVLGAPYRRATIWTYSRTRAISTRLSRLLTFRQVPTKAPSASARRRATLSWVV